MAKIIVVDDDLIVLDVLTKLLERSHHQVWPVGNADDALALLDGRGAVDLAIIDLVLKASFGLDLIRRIRLRLPSLPIIAMSGYVFAESKAALEMLRVAGVARVLSKPIAPAILDEAVIAALPRARMNDATTPGPAVM